MAEQEAPQKESTTSLESEVALGEFGAFAQENAEDKKRILWTYGFVILVHFIVILINFPSFATDINVEKKRPKVFVIQHPTPYRLFMNPTLLR